MESQFAADSSGFSTCRFDRWYDAKWGKEKSQRHWLKAHIVIGTKTNIITAVEVTSSNVNDSPVLPRLLDRTAQRFTMAEVSADKAYLSEANLRHIEGHGAYPYIPFKSNTTGQGSPMWKRLYAYFTLNEAAFNAHYHRRSNVETAFSMIKGKFGDLVRAKSETGQVNEILLQQAKVEWNQITKRIREGHYTAFVNSQDPGADDKYLHEGWLNEALDQIKLVEGPADISQYFRYAPQEDKDELPPDLIHWVLLLGRFIYEHLFPVPPSENRGPVFIGGPGM